MAVNPSKAQAQRNPLKAVCIGIALTLLVAGCHARESLAPVSVSSASSPSVEASPAVAAPSEADRQSVARWCKELKGAITQLQWKLDPCEGLEWKVGGHSMQGRPLLYAEFGNPSTKNTTLILSAVHGDEITPVYLGVQLVRWLKGHPAQLESAHVVVAPLVNPDGFYHHPRHRTNAHRVDINRNFPTHDWEAEALKAWKTKFHSDPRRFPGPASGSEPETAFQQELIRIFAPQKILSVHSPLNFTDYDGPTHLSLDKFPTEYVEECLKLRSRLKATPGTFFPGSLGNYAGQEMGIPTITLELPTADATRANQYWLQFSKGIQVMIEFVVPSMTILTSPAHRSSSTSS
jgi:protein MpaA